MEKLRLMRDEDLSAVLLWRNAEQVRKNMYTYHEIGEDEHQAWWERESSNPETRLLIFEIDDSPSGVVGFTKYSGPGGTASWMFYSGDVSRRGVGPMMEKAALTYAFEELELRRLECEVLSHNLAVVNFHLRHGFSLEGVLREAYVREGETFDIYKLAMLRSYWKRYVAPDLETLGRKGGASLLGKTVRRRVTLNAARIQSFVEASGDRNPIHLDSAHARNAGFQAPISHGMLVGSLFSEIFASDMPGPGSIYRSQTLEFLAPVQVNSEVEVVVTVISHIGRMVRAKTEVFCSDVLCVTGAAEIIAGKSKLAAGG